MKMAKFISLCSTLAFIGLTSACHQESKSILDIIRGQPLAPDSPALNNVVGLSLNGLSTFCTGSVVAEDIVVTAAHCVSGLKSFYVVFGPPNRIMQKIEVVQVETFKPYGEAAFPNFDIAWLKLKTKVPAGFKPLEVLRDPALLKKAKEFRLAGYGFEKTNCFTNDCSDELLEAKTALDKYHDNARLMSLLVFKGAAALGFGGACNGDSGGPAYAKIDDRWYLIGVTNGTTAYMTPEAHANPAQSCEAGSDIYTFMGDYVPWIQKRSTQQLIQRPETNPDRAESPFVVKGEVKPAQALEPSTWAEWIQYPYHNEQVWNTIDRLLWQILELRRPELPAEELIKIWGDGAFSQDQVESITDLDFQLNSTETLRYQDQPLDLRPLGTWTGLKTLRLTEEAAAVGIESISRLTSLRSLTLVAPATLRERALDLTALQKLGSSLETLSLTNFTPGELQTIPFQAFKQLTSLHLAAQPDRIPATLDLTGLQALEQVSISNWAYASRITLPKAVTLRELELDTSHTTDLQWLDLDSIQAIETLVIDRDVLSSPVLMKGFQNKSIRKLIASGNGLTAEHFPAQGFADLKDAVLNSNLISDARALRILPALQSLELRDNPLTGTDCPTGVNCVFDSIPNPKTVADYCRNTLTDTASFHKPMIQMLLRGFGFPSFTYDALRCDQLNTALSQSTELQLQGYVDDYEGNGVKYDLRVLKSLKQLKSLKIRNANLVNAEALAELPNLTLLDLDFVKTRQLAFIPKMSALTNLNYTDFPRSNLEGVSHTGLKVLTVSTVGPQAFSIGGQLTSIGPQTKLPSLTTLSVRGNPLQDLNGVESFRNLTQLDLTATQVKDLGPLSALIGTTVVLGEGYKLATCPILYGRCESGERNLTGGNFGAAAENIQTSKWSVGQVVPGFGKALRN